jgi:hypothetical protein
MRPGPLRAGQQERHPSEHPFERAFHRMQRDHHRRIFPKQNVMLKINAGVAQFQMQRRHQFAFDVISDAAEGFVLHVCGQLDGDSHDFIFG